MTMAHARAELLEHLALGDRLAARAALRRLQDDGVATPVLISEIFAPVMAEVGERWLRNEWSVAQEHAATSVVDSLLGGLELEPSSVVATTGTVVAVCATGEWHVTPLRMFAELLRRRGWNVRVLGASVPANHLARHLSQHPASAVVLSCSIARFLPGGAAIVAAAHRAGVPVLAGGAAFGHDQRRAQAIGADAWAPDATTAAAVLSAWAAQAPPLSTGVPAMEPPTLSLVQRTARVVELLGRAEPETELGPTEDLVRDVLGAADASLLCHDETILVDELRWVAAALGPRRPGPALVAHLAAAVAAAEPGAAARLEHAVGLVAASQGS